MESHAGRSDANMVSCTIRTFDYAFSIVFSTNSNNTNFKIFQKDYENAS